MDQNQFDTMAYQLSSKLHLLYLYQKMEPNKLKIFLKYNNFIIILNIKIQKKFLPTTMPRVFVARFSFR